VRIVVKQTNLLISGFGDLAQEGERLIHACRKDLEDYLERHPAFGTSLIPITCDPAAPPIVHTMAAAAAQTGVGPMAAVAGAVAEWVGLGLLPHSRDVIVENGGDIFLRSTRERRVLILAETSKFSSVTIVLPPSPVPIGLCTSSGILGHSLSFGRADAVTVLWSSAPLADAAATAIANVVKHHGDADEGLRLARQIGVDGVVIIVGGHLAVWGRIALAG